MAALSGVAAVSSRIIIPSATRASVSLASSSRYFSSSSFSSSSLSSPKCLRSPPRISHLILNQRGAEVRASSGGYSTVSTPKSFASEILIQKKAADVSPELKGTSIFLLGMKSSLKTSMGKLLADTLRYYYFDSDNLVEEAAGGASEAKSFRLSDENGFREFETEVLKQLSSMGRLVVCAGNGAVQSSTNLAFMRHGITIWIDVPLDMVARDLFENRREFASFEIPPAGSHSEVLTQLDSLYNKSRDGYATADAVISLQKVASRLGYENLGDITVEDMTLEAVKEIEKLTRTKKMMEEAARPF